MTNKQKVKDRVMLEIKSNKVIPRSKYIFLAEKLGLGSAFVFSLVLAVLFFNLLLFYLKTSDNLAYLSFGIVGLLAFLETFPYLLVVSFILFLFLAGYLIMKSDISYKKPFGYLVISLIGFVVVSGGILTYTDIPMRIEQETYNSVNRGFFSRSLIGGRLINQGRGAAGIISELSDTGLIVQTTSGLKNIDLKKAEILDDQKLEVGQFIVIIGQDKDDYFLAQKIRILNEDEPPMIRRGINHYFCQNAANSCPMVGRGHNGHRECNHGDCPLMK